MRFFAGCFLMHDAADSCLFFSYFRTVYYCKRIFNQLSAVLLFNAAHNDHNHENGAEALFSSLFRQYEHRLYTLAVRLTKSDQVAKDIIQDVFLKLWEHRSGMASIDNMEAWLYRVTENKVIDFLRKAAADSRLRQKIWNRLQHNTDEAEQLVAAKEYNQFIRAAIEKLPPQRKRIYQLNKEEGLNYQQIADELQLSRHTVKNQLFSAVQSLRRIISRNSSFFSFFF